MFIVDKKQTIKWATAAIARGIAWALAGWLGMESTLATETGTQIGTGIGALVLAGISIWTSTKGRKKILDTPPPK